MIKRLLNWFKTRRVQSDPTEVKETWSRDEVLAVVEEARLLAYNDGKRDGLTIAREQASKSLKEILWQQNQQNKIK